MRTGIRLSCAVVLCALVVGANSAAHAQAVTLCFDDPSEVVGAGGVSCCRSGLLDAAPAPGCGERAYSCRFETTCGLSLKGDTTVRIIDGSMAVAPATRGFLWAPHRCCVDGSLVTRPAAEVSAWSPHPLVCDLQPGCRVEIEHAAKYAVDVPPELAVATMPWTSGAWEMFLACAADQTLNVADCASEWLLPRCAAAICAPDYRDRLITWLAKVTAARGAALPPASPGDRGQVATLFTSPESTCCIAGTERPGAYLVGGLLRMTACDYDARCVPAEGDVVFYGEEELLVAKGDAWSQLPSTCQAQLDALDGALGLLESRLVASETAAADMRETLQAEVQTCREDLHDLKQQGGGACSPPPTPPIVTVDDVLEVAGDSASIELLDNDSFGDAEVISVSPPTRGIAVWQADGRLTYYPNPGFVGSETLFYQVVDAAGHVATGAVKVAIQ